MNDTIIRKLDRWIFESFEVTGEGLGLFRIFASLLILFFLIPGDGVSHYGYLSSLPPGFFAPPPGPMMFFDEFPPFIFFQIVLTLLVIFLLAMAAGYQTRWASVMVGILILVLQGFVYSVGKVNHEILIPVVPIVMSFSNWGACFSVDSWLKRNNNRDVHSWPLTLLALFIAFMMFTAGFPKILGGWFDPSTQAVKGHVLNQFFVKDRDALLAPYALQIHSQLLWEILDWSTILFEVGFIIAVWRARLFKLFLIVAVFFHFSTQLLMNISFLPNFLAYTVFLNWEQIFISFKSFHQRLFGIRNNRLHIKTALSFAGIVLFIFLILKWFSVQDIFLPDTDLMFHESVFLFVAVSIVLYISIKHLFGKSENTKRKAIY